MMKVKKVKKKCMVHGCKRTDTYALTCGHEFGASVIICKECLEKATHAVQHCVPIESTIKTPSAPPPLFFSVTAEETVKEKEKTKTKEPALESKEIKEEGETQPTKPRKKKADGGKA